MKNEIKESSLKFSSGIGMGLASTRGLQSTKSMGNLHLGPY